MKTASFAKSSILLSRFINTFPLLMSVFCCTALRAQPVRFKALSTDEVLDGRSMRFNGLQPGDTIFVKGGNRDKLLIRNFTGAPGRPITFINEDAVVNIHTNSYYGISISNCTHIRFTGQGTNGHFYGIQVKQVAAGSGIGIGGFSSDVEIDHLSIANCRNSGIVAKTDPDCTLKAVRDSFTQFNTRIHDNLISSVGNEGMYIGSAYYAGTIINCNGKDTVVQPAVLNDVQVYNNIIEHTGWDGIQVSAAPVHCKIYNNKVSHDSEAEFPNQMSGILIGGGSKCDCYNNLVKDGKGDGIEDHGLGGNKIYNNIIVNAGKSYIPADRTKMKHGIFVSDVSVLKDSSFSILFNTIIHPKSDGIRFQSIKSKQNLVASNCIIGPGNYNLYETDNTSFAGKDAYVMIPNAATDLQLKNNFFTLRITAAGIAAADYSPLPGSPLINKGYQQAAWLKNDFINTRRPKDGLYDIGAMEYNSGDDRLFDTMSAMRSMLFPNPVSSKLTVKYTTSDSAKTVFTIYNEKGERQLQQYQQEPAAGLHEIRSDVSRLPAGTYFYSIKNGNEILNGKFLKH
jgi:Right handed beta helix region/Secretion system C-terminal sorting domain